MSRDKKQTVMPDENAITVGRFWSRRQDKASPPKPLMLLVGLLVGGIGSYLLLMSNAATICDRTATTSTFAAQVSAATAGQSICLESGDYGTWAGTNKAITIKPADGATPVMALNLGNGDANFTIDGRHTKRGTDGLKITSAQFLQSPGPSNITIKNTAFSGTVDSGSGLINVDGPNPAAPLVFDGNEFYDVHGWKAAIHFPYSGNANTVIKNNLFRDFDSDAIAIGDAAVQVLNNEFVNIKPSDPSQHTDVIQYGSAVQPILIDGNWIYGGCEQGIGAFDGTANATITNNIIEGCTAHSLVVGGSWTGSDAPNVVAHNTVIGSSTATINCTAKINGAWGPLYPTRVQIRDNITQGGLELSTSSPNGQNCTPMQSTNNLCYSGCSSPNLSGTPTFAVAANRTKPADYALAANSPVGRNAASDGANVGVNAATVGPQTPVEECTVNVTSASLGNLNTAVNNAQAGDIICLVSGDYGNWAGTNKAVTIRAASGATPQMKFSFGNGDTGFTLEGLTGMGGAINGSASNITIKNSVFTSSIDMDGSAVRGIVLDGNSFDWMVGPTFGGLNSKIFASVGGTLAAPGATIKNNTFRNGDLDGVHVGGSGLIIENNVFDNICDFNLTQDGKDSNHADAIQFQGGSEIRISGNYVRAGASCATQGITSFDSGTNGVIIENNVVDIRRPWGIEWYSDQNSIIRHNTIVWYGDADCFFTGQQCGQIDVTRKSQDPAGSGTQVYDNIVTAVNFGNGSTGTSHHNVSGQTAVYAGGASPSNHDGFLLAANSPVGRNAASDGTNIGVYALGSSSPSLPSDTTAPAVNLTAPSSGATVSGSVTVSANATDDTGVSSVQFKLDGSNLGAADTSAPYSISWDASQVSNGTHVLTAVARDAAGNTTESSSVTVTVTGGLSLSDLLRGAYHFNEGSGTTAADVSGRSNTLTLVNGAAWAGASAGKYGNAMTLDGTNDHATAPDSDSLDLTAQGTISTWVKFDAIGPGYRGIISKGNVNAAASQNYALEMLPSGVLQCIIGNGSGSVAVSSSTTVTANTFYHLACVWNGSTLKVYINGVERGSTAQTITPAGNAAPLHVGKFGGAEEYVDGTIDDVRIYATALSASQLTADMDAGVTAPALPAIQTIWPSSAVPGTAAASDTQAVEVGVKFRSDVAGTINGVRFYKGSGNTGTHIGNLWTASGTKLASVTFTGETATGWQQALFSSPVSISANTTYIVSYFAPAGRYAVNAGYFASQATDSGSLHALRDGTDGANGVYRYGSSSGFPTSTYQSSNYWVDVVFAAGPPDTTAPTAPSTFTATATAFDQVNLAWSGATDPGSPSTGIANYLIYRYVTSAGSNTAQVIATVGTVSSYSDTTVLGSTGYSYYVMARDAASNLSPASATRAVTTPATPPDTTPPSTPTNAIASASSNQVNLFWTASTDSGSSGLAGYNVYRQTGSGTAVKLNDGLITGTTYGDAIVTVGTTYTYTIEAVDGAGNVSVKASTTPANVTIPATNDCLAVNNCFPKPVNAGLGATGIPAGRTLASGCTTNPASGAVLTDCLFTGGVTITTTGSGATYRFSEFRGQVTHAGSGTLTVEYSNFGPTSGCSRYDNSFQGNNYTVRYSRFNQYVSEGPRVSGNNILIEENFIGPMCADPDDHADGIQGYYGGTNVVVRHNTIDQRGATGGVNSPIFFADNSVSAEVRDNLIAGGGYSLRLHDDFTPDQGPWVLIGNRIVNGAWSYGPMNNTGTSFTAETCSNNRLVTIDSAYNILTTGNMANCDGSTSAPDSVAPTAPTLATPTTPSPTSVSLSWSGATDNVGVTGYTVYRYVTSAGSGTAQVIATLGNVSTYTDTTAVAATGYTYYVRSKDAANNTSSNSNTRAITTPNPPDTTAPSNPGSPAATATSSTQVDLSWTASTDNVSVAGYNVYRNGSTTPLNTTLIAHPSSGTTVTYGDATVSPSTTYTYTIEAVDGAGNKSAKVGTSPASVSTPASGVIASPQWPNTGITHGSELNASVVGYGALGVTQAQLTAAGTPPNGSYWDISVGMTRPSFVPAGNYVFNNDPNNHGGTVPAGGMYIDGFFVPAGTWVVQFQKFSHDMYVRGTSGPGFLFRGSEFRGATRAPGWFNIAYNPPANTSFWFHFSDFGGLGAANNQYDESPLTMSYTTGTASLFRNYFSYTTTAMNATNVNVTVIENVIEKLTCYYCPGNPPNESTSKHLNGIQWMGSPTSALVLRNKIILQNPDEAGRTIDQTDALMFNNSTGALLGTGTNIDGSTGYIIKDNLLGGGGYTIYGGLENGNPAQVANMKVTGNKFQTVGTWPQSGAWGPIGKPPVWGSYGNIATDNTWYDGPNVGGLAFGSASTPTDTTPPTAPTTFTATAANASQVNLAWSGATDPGSPSSGITNYLIYRYVTSVGSGTAQVIANLGNVSTYTDTTVTANTGYSYYVVARDGANNLSSNSVTRAITTPTPPDTTAPSNPGSPTATAASSTQVNLSWTKSTDNVSVAGYNVYRNGSTTPLNTTLIAHPASGTTVTYGDATVNPSTTYTYTIEAVDSAGNKSGKASTTPTSVTTPAIPDTTAPTISSIATSNITATTVTITWTTNEPATSQVEYGPTIAYGTNTTLSSTLKTSHSVTLTGLSATTGYHYRVKSRDAASNLATSSDRSFTTTAAPDTTAPDTIITDPKPASDTATTASFTFVSSENNSTFQCKLDNEAFTACTSPMTYTNLATGSHTFSVKATDSSNNTDQTPATHNWTISSPPPPSPSTGGSGGGSSSPTPAPVNRRAGDTNGDNRVTLQDLSVLLSNYNKTTAKGDYTRGDFNGDGQVTLADLSMLLSQYGR